MKYYSESLDDFFDTEAELRSAEASAQTAEKNRKLELDCARKTAEEAERRYLRLLGKYCKDYGMYSYPADCEEDLTASELADILSRIGFHIV